MLGLTKSEIETIETNAFMRYGILAKTPILQNADSIDKKSIWLLHTWGVNLENKDTPDALYVFEDDEFSQTRYMELLRQVFIIFETACEHVHEQTNHKVVLRVAKLGFGAWLKKMPKKYQEPIKKEYEHMLLALSEKYEWLQIRHPIYPKHITLATMTGFPSSKGRWKIIENNHDPFGKPKFYHDPNYIDIPYDSELIIVNAWDDRSFIGNGGSHDKSMDGYLVAGPSKYFPMNEFDNIMGSNMINASYLHNVFFCTNLLHESQWITY